MNNIVKKFPYNEDVIEILENKIFALLGSESIYYKYPNIFKDFFYPISEEKMDKLNNASLFIYLYVCLSDNFFDRKEIKKEYLNSFNLAHIFYDEGIKILSQLFKNDKTFWDVWNYRRSIFFSVNTYNNKIGFNLDDYILLSQNKSELGKIAIDSLYILNGQNNKKEYDNLLKAHDLFSMGFQLLDDIEDFSIDLKENNTTNYILNEMINNGIDINNYKLVQEDYLNLKNLIKSLNLSIIYFDKADNVLSNSKSYFSKIINMKKQKAILYLNEIQKINGR